MFEHDVAADVRYDEYVFSNNIQSTYMVIGCVKTRSLCQVGNLYTDIESLSMYTGQTARITFTFGSDSSWASSRTS